MRSWIYGLGVLFICQLALIALFNLDWKDQRASRAQEKLVAFAPEAVNRIEIGDGDTQVKLVKASGQWQLPELDDFPADSARVAQLLDRLADLRRGWPVATTTASVARFKVGDEEYERKITLYQGDQVISVLHVGTSPSFRKVHVRRVGEDEVYSVAFNAYEAEARQDDWIDGAFLTIDETEVSGVRWPNFSLQREGETFRLQGVSEGESMTEEQANALVRKLAELRIQSVMDAEHADVTAEQSQVAIELTKTGGATLQYRFVKPTSEATYYFAERSDHPYRFKVAEFDVKPLVEAAPAKTEGSTQDDGAKNANEVSSAEDAVLEQDSGT